MGCLNQVPVQKVLHLSAQFLFLLRTQPAGRLLNKPCSRRQVYLMTGSPGQAHIMIAAAEHILVLRKYLRHYQTFSLTLTAITDIPVQIYQVFRHRPPADPSEYSTGLLRCFHGRPYILLLHGVELPH